MKSYVEILNKLVSFPTVNNPVEKIFPDKDILDYIEEEILKPNNFESIQFEENNYWSLVSYLKRKNPKILFIGHCDVVPPGPDWQTNPFELEIIGDKAYGRGATDMKGSVAVMLSLAKEFSELIDATIIYALNLDEESGGQFGAGKVLQILEREKIRPDFVVNGDANGLQIVNRRRNPYVISLNMSKRIKQLKGIKKTRTFKTKIAGNRTMHAAYFMRDLDTHCADVASDFLRVNSYKVQKITGPFVKNNVLPSNISVEYIIPTEEGDEIHEYDENLTNFLYHVKKFETIDIPSKPSDYGINLTFNYLREDKESNLCQMDLRIMNNQMEDVENYFKNFVESSQLKTEIEVKGSIVPVYTPLNSLLVQQSIIVAEEMNLSSETIEMGGATDSRWFSAESIPSIEFGPLGGNVHGANEFVELSSLEIVRQFYLKLVTRLSEHSKE
ncbi:MAG: M20/M25/M40 family metallo-hydrolase [Candidatus Heimdallarchaeota archaeon]